MEQNELISNLLEDLDISETLYINAEEKYKAIGNFLENKGINCKLIPIGSFATGTVVKPFVNNQDKNYDLDILTLIKTVEVKPEIIRKSLKEELDNSIYSKKYKEWDKCFTIEYAESNGIEFSLDLVPAVEQSEVYIACKRQNNFYLESSSALGFLEWFNNINERFLNQSKFEYMKRNKEYTEINTIPKYRVKSELQKAIQFLKRHRDVYYDRSKKNDLKIESIFLSVFLSEIASDKSEDLRVLDLISLFIEYISEIDLSEYSSIFVDIKWSDKKIEVFRRWTDGLQKDLFSTREETKELTYRGILGIRAENNQNGSVTRIQPWQL